MIANEKIWELQIQSSQMFNLINFHLKCYKPAKDWVVVTPEWKLCDLYLDICKEKQQGSFPSQ